MEDDVKYFFVYGCVGDSFIWFVDVAIINVWKGDCAWLNPSMICCVNSEECGVFGSAGMLCE